GDKIRSQTKPFLYLFQLVAAKDPVHDGGYMLDIAIQMTAIWGRLQAPEITAEYGVTTTAGGWHGLIPSPFGRGLG
ncbi:hypothetical protein, partial [Aeromonas allosaccharophila]|uniref:hypothetical protein n=1 Tax=Aeromonas allosaccharophila TaxID=656 RepID=UPI003007169A